MQWTVPSNGIAMCHGASPSSVTGPLADFFSHDFELIEGADDVGMLMASPLEVLADETADAFEVFHAGWGDRVEAEASALAWAGVGKFSI